MPKKTVTQLKKKHRDHIWRDEEGDYWYWDAIKLAWCVILADLDGGFYISDKHDPIYYTDKHDPIYYTSFDRVASSPLAKSRRHQK